MSYKSKYLKYKTKYNKLYYDLLGSSEKDQLQSSPPGLSKPVFDSKCTENVKKDNLELNIDFQRDLTSNDLENENSFKNYRNGKTRNATNFIQRNHIDKHQNDPTLVKNWNQGKHQKGLQSHLKNIYRLEIKSNRTNNDTSRRVYQVVLNNKNQVC
jgi:hypothetical protein